MDDRTKEQWSNQSKKISNILRFINNLNTITACGEFESNYCIIYPEQSELGKENTDKHMRLVLCIQTSK